MCFYMSSFEFGFFLHDKVFRFHFIYLKVIICEELSSDTVSSCHHLIGVLVQQEGDPLVDVVVVVVIVVVVVLVLPVVVAVGDVHDELEHEDKRGEGGENCSSGTSFILSSGENMKTSRRGFGKTKHESRKTVGLK